MKPGSPAIRTCKAGLLAIILATTGLGCATLATSGSLPAVASYEGLNRTKHSITVRFYVREDLTGQDGRVQVVELRSPSDFGERVRQSFAKSGAFSQVELELFSSTSISSSGVDEPVTKSILMEPLTRIKTDYFFDIVDHSQESPSPDQWGLFLCLPAILSIGLIPCPQGFKTNLHGTLYDTKGRQLTTHHVTDDATAWAWTPLILWPGAKRFAQKREAAGTMVLKATENLLQTLLKSGQLK